MDLIYKCNKRFMTRIVLFILIAFISACSSDQDTEAPVTKSISGDVYDGPIKNGILKVRDADGEIIATGRTDERGGYNLDLPNDAKRRLPF